MHPTVVTCCVPNFLCDSDCGPVVRTATFKNRWAWDGNWTIYWFLGACLSLWFTLGRGIPYLVFTKNPVAFIHVLFSIVISINCGWNLFHTPTHGPTYKLAHIWLGRIALVLSTVSVLFGFVIYWVFSPSGVPFLIALTIGGVVQIVSSITGFHYIRQYRMLKQMKETIEMSTMPGCVINNPN